MCVKYIFVITPGVPTPRPKLPVLFVRQIKGAIWEKIGLRSFIIREIYKFERPLFQLENSLLRSIISLHEIIENNVSVGMAKNKK